MTSPFIQTPGRPRVTFTDIESDVIAFLSSQLEVPVKLTVPNPRPERFVRAWRTGGAAASRVLDLPQITVEAWSKDDEDAWVIATTAREALFQDYTAMPLVRRVTEAIGPYYIPDPESKMPRYRFTVELRVRARR